MERWMTSECRDCARYIICREGECGGPAWPRYVCVRGVERVAQRDAVQAELARLDAEIAGLRARLEEAHRRADAAEEMRADLRAEIDPCTGCQGDCDYCSRTEAA